MPDLDYNVYATFISICSLIVSLIACYQTSKTVKLANRAMLSMYLISSKNGTYVKVKNFGNSNAKIISFNSNVDPKKAKLTDRFPFPLVGLHDIFIGPGTSKIALIDNKYLNSNNWISVTYYDELTKKEYSFKLELNTYNEYALVAGDDFNLVDY